VEFGFSAGFFWCWSCWFFLVLILYCTFIIHWLSLILMF